MDVAIDTFRDLLKKFTDSPKLLETLQAITVNLKAESILPSLDVETRWNNTWAMIWWGSQDAEALEELQQGIRDAHDGYSSFTITPTDRLARRTPDESWSCMQDFCKF